MTELEKSIFELLKQYPSQSKTELRILNIKERPEYGDKIITRRYIITIDMDEVQSCKESVKT